MNSECDAANQTDNVIPVQEIDILCVPKTPYADHLQV